MATVEYRPIPGFEGYRVGSDGTIWSRWVKKSRGFGFGSHSVIGDEWKQLTPVRHNNDYLFVTLCGPGIRKAVSIHSRVLIAFRGPCPDGMESCHRDGNRANNALDNLEWGTHKANSQDRIRHGTQINGERVWTNRLTREQAMEIRRRANDGERGSDLAIEFNVHRATVYGITSGRNWKNTAQLTVTKADEVVEISKRKGDL